MNKMSSSNESKENKLATPLVMPVTPEDNNIVTLLPIEEDKQEKENTEEIQENNNTEEKDSIIDVTPKAAEAFHVKYSTLTSDQVRLLQNQQPLLQEQRSCCCCCPMNVKVLHRVWQFLSSNKKFSAPCLAIFCTVFGMALLLLSVIHSVFLGENPWYRVVISRTETGRNWHQYLYASLYEDFNKSIWYRPTPRV